MSAHTELRTLLPGMTAFPEAADIFVADQPWLAEHLLPLLSIDLGLVRPELAGTVVHMLNPVEPVEGYIGDGTEAFHNAYTTRNWFAFSLTQDNRYRFLGQEGYFQRAPVHQGAFTQDDFEREHEAEMLASYARAKAHFAAQGVLARDFGYGDGPEPMTYLDALGGELSFSNWAVSPSVPSAFTWSDSDGHARYPDREPLPNDGLEIALEGRAFFQVATVAADSWCSSGADSILLFYEPQSRTALFTFDWT